MGRVRYRIETVFGQLTDRCLLKRVWARDLWHVRNRRLADGSDTQPGTLVQSAKRGSFAPVGASRGVIQTTCTSRYLISFHP
jgi:hypothetical protein